MEILEDVRNRQWPVPDEPWVLKQAWNDLLFAHWPVAREELRALVPSFLALDLFDNQAWLTISPFRLSDLRPRGIPSLPGLSSFDEINVRTYVVHDGRPGIYFFSLDANSTLAVSGASALFHLPYFLARIRVEIDRGSIAYVGRRVTNPAARLEARYAPAGPPFEPAPATLDYFLTERYCLYTQGAAAAYRVEIQHRPWRLQAAEAEISVNTMADVAGIRLASTPPLLHFARRQDVLTWRPHALD